MINLNILEDMIQGYKQYFQTHWEGEKYKWIAVKHFQENWDIDAPDFGEMFERATAEAGNLLISRNVYPRGMILEFAKADNEATRDMFRMLFDESLDLKYRIDAFRFQSDRLRERYGNDEWKQHYQNTNFISTYLWLRFPDKYYIYKYELFQKCADLLDDSYRPKANGAAEHVIGGYQMYDEIRAELLKDKEIREMLDAVLDDECYPDPMLNTATIDFGYYAARYYQQKEKPWFPTPEQYTPGLSVENWVTLLNDPTVFDENSLTMMRGFYECGGQATCKEVAIRNGNSPKFYIFIAVKLAKRIHKKTNCPIMPQDYSENSTWWPILFVGKHAEKEQEGVYVWKLRDELKEAYEMMIQHETSTVSASWLLAWNPTNYDWGNMVGERSFDTMLQTVRSGRGYFDEWRCATTKVQAGDRVYIMRLGSGITPKGIVASGYAVSGNYVDADGAKRIRIMITGALDFRESTIIAQDELKQRFPEQDWSPQSSGISIQADAAKWLHKHFGVQGKTDIPKVYTIDEIRSFHSNVRFKKWFAPLIDALLALDGTASRPEAHQRIIELNAISKEELENKHKLGHSQVLNDIDWARQYLTYECILDPNAPDGIWRLTELGKKRVMTDDLSQKIIKKWTIINAAKRNHTPIPIIDLSPLYRFQEIYDKNAFLHDVFLTESEYDKLAALVKTKKNVILQGAPGVGKSFSAKRLAWSLMGEKDDSRIAFVQFHQSYSYEDFIMGYRPTEDGGFALQEGIFYQFCQAAQDDPEHDYYFIIDEINRGNLSKIFGELLMLIEADKRGTDYQINLVYGKTSFWIPNNLHIIGMMNTADRSLAMIDYALRRRFSFYTMKPAFENASANGFGEYMNQISCSMYHSVVNRIKSLNEVIRKDNTFGKGFEIGHSYFAPENPSVVDDAWVQNVVEFEIIPLIEEYWFDNETEQKKWKKALYETAGIAYDE